MAQINQDIVVYANTDFEIRVEDIYNENTGVVLAVGDIIGASWAMTPFEDEVSPLVEKDLVGGGITVPEDGTVVVNIASSDIDGLSGEFTHELRLKHSGGTQVALRGKIRMLYQVANNPL